MMDEKWGSGDPNQYLTSTDSLAYDDHEYVKYAGVAQSQDAYLAYSCADDRSGDSPVIVGEWSLSVDSAIENDSDWDPSTNVQWYKQWWAAQVMSYEKTAQGWGKCQNTGSPQKRGCGAKVIQCSGLGRPPV